MGLDFVELVMVLEDQFGIDIANDEAASVVTVDDLWRIVSGKVKPARCATSTAFYQIRRGLMETAGCARAEIRPGTRLETLLPRQRRSRLWKDLGRHLGRRLPGAETVGDLARSLAPADANWATYRQIVAEELGLEIGDITPEASFLDDLRVD